MKAMYDPRFLLAEGVFITLKNDATLGIVDFDALMERLFSSVDLYFNLSVDEQFKSSILKELRALENRNERVRVDIFSKSREQLFQNHFSIEDLDYKVFRTPISGKRGKLKLMTMKGPGRVASLEKVKLIDYAQSSFLRRLVAQESFDDVLMVSEDGKILELSSSNIIFMDEEKRWFTPKENIYLGHTREKLLNDGKIEEKDIFIQDLGKFCRAYAINGVEGFISIEVINDFRFKVDTGDFFDG